MRGAATWRIIAKDLIVSGSLSFLCLPLYSSTNLKSSSRATPSLLFFYIPSLSISSKPFSSLLLRSICSLFVLPNRSLSSLYRIRQISFVFQRFLVVSSDFIASRSNPGIC